MKFRFRHNLVTKFILRVVVAVVLVTLLGQWLIVRYYKGVVTERAGATLQEIVTAYARFPEPLSVADGIARREVVADVAARFSEGRLWLLEVYDEHRALVSARRSDDPARQAQLTRASEQGFDVFPTDDDIDFEFSKTETGEPLLRVFTALVDDGRLLGYLRAVALIDPELVAEADDKVRLARNATLLATGAMLVLVFPLIVAAYRKLNRNRLALLRSNLRTIVALTNAITKRDSDTQEHNYRVTLYSVALAEEMGLAVESMPTLIKGAILHDVGKIGIRDAVLLKPGRLDQDEFRVMQTHVLHGAQIVADVEWLADSKDVILYHHEKYDGSGYDEGLNKGSIPLVARIFAIVDVFDALASPRPYKDALSLDEVFTILGDGRGTHFEPQVVDTLLHIASGLHGEIGHLSVDELEARLSAKVDEYFGCPL